MNTVDYLLEDRFATQTIETKLEIKRLGRHRPDGLIITQRGKTQNRAFSSKWFDEKPWLTASESKKSLFCFPCILFGVQGAWTKGGITDLKHLSERVKSHEKSPGHLTSCLKLEMMGNVNIGTQLDTGYRLSIRKHNQTVDKNRHVLSKIIDCIKFCGSFELALRGHDEKKDSNNPGIFRGLIDFVSEIDNVMGDHIENSTVFKGTSKTIQNDLLDAMYGVYLDTIAREIEETNFVSIQADETTDVACKCQLVIVLRYLVKGEIKERFLAFEEAKEKHANAITHILLNVLRKHTLKDKLIAQTYDGAATMSGRIHGVQTQIRQSYPHAHFVHCYAHQLNLIMEQACSKHVRQCKIFFANLSAFPTFFSVSTKRTAAFKEYCKKKIPRGSATRWNFHSRTVNSVYEHRHELLKFLVSVRDGYDQDEVVPIDHDDATTAEGNAEEMVNENANADEKLTYTEFDWDHKTINEAAGLIKWLEDDEFTFLLEFFHIVMPHVDILFAVLQKRDVSVDVGNRAVRSFIQAVTDVREGIDGMSYRDDESDQPRQKRRKTSKQELASACKEACDIMTTQATDRFNSIGHLIPLQLVDPQLFVKYATSFPDDKLDLVAQYYPMICKEKLKTELSILYKGEDFHSAKSSLDLFQFMVENNLTDPFSEACRLLEIALTIPLVSAEAERCFSTLKRILTFLRNTMANNRLNALATLSIQKEMIREMRTFNQLVIEKFATSKTRRAEFLYKTFARVEDNRP